MRSITVNVANHGFQVRSDADEEYIQRLAEEITERYKSIKVAGRRPDQEFRSMAMVAIALLDEAMQARQQCESIRDKTRGFALQMIHKIEALLDKGRP